MPLAVKRSATRAVRRVTRASSSSSFCFARAGTRERKLNHLALSKDDTFLLASTAAGEVQVWELRNPAAPISVGVAHSHEVSEAHWSPDGKQAVSVGVDCCICVWNFFG